MNVAKYVKNTMTPTPDGTAVKEVMPPVAAWALGAAPFPPTPAERHVPIDVDVHVKSNPEGRARAAARKVYESFQGRAPGRSFKLDVPDMPAEMPLLGQCEEIVYSVPDGVDSNRSGYRWRHKWGDEGNNDTGVKPLILAAAEEGVLLLVTPPGKKKFRVTDRGIVG